MNKQKHREHVERGYFHRVCRGVNSTWAHEQDKYFLRAVRSWRGPRGQYSRNKARLKAWELEAHNAQMQ